MAKINKLLEAPPYAVMHSLQQLGANLKTARLRRNLTIQEMADKIGTGIRAVSDAEKGKSSTGIAVYVGLLWALGLLDQLTGVATPAKDIEGLSLSLAHGKKRARQKESMDNDF